MQKLCSSVQPCTERIVKLEASSVDLGPVSTTLKEFENGGLTQEEHQMFSVHTALEEFKNVTITGHFGFVFEGNLVREIARLSLRHCFRKVPFLKYFPSTRKRKAIVFKFLHFEERFRFRDELVWTVGLTIEIKLRF